MGEDVGQLGIAQQRFGGDAADVEADSAPILLLHHSDLEAELAGADGGDVATGARTENDEIEMGHASSLANIRQRSRFAPSAWKAGGMRFLVAGSSGFLGTHLVQELRAGGHDVIGLVRSGGGADTSVWDPYDGRLDPHIIEQSDVVVNLAGSPTAGNPHSKKWASDLEHSRVTTTRVLAEAIARSSRRPAFIAGNGISYYGDHGAEVLDETADSRGDALLTRVTRVWEQATQAAAEAGARVVVLRTSPVLDPRSAPLKQQLLQFRLGLGGRLGSGRQFFPCIGLSDWVGGVIWSAEQELSGPVNLCLPPVPTNREYTEALATAVGRPAVMHVPEFVLRRAAGAMAPELLGSLRCAPKALLESGYEFDAADITALLAQVVPR